MKKYVPPPLDPFTLNDPTPAPIPRVSRFLWVRKLLGGGWFSMKSHPPSRPVETDAERREKLGWKIIGAQIAHTSRHHP